MIKIQMIRGFNIPEERISLDELVNNIKGDVYKPQIEQYRKALKERPMLAKGLKTKLPAFTPSALFENGIKRENLVEYTQLIMLDVDKVGHDSAVALKKNMSENEHVLFAAVSPSGDGLKVLIKTNSTFRTHFSAYKQVVKYYYDKFKVRFDPACKNFNRLCFITHDPDAYYNTDASVFNVKLEDVVENDICEMVETDEKIEALFKQAVIFTTNRQKFEEGSRNNFIHLLAANCNRYGLEEEFVIDRCNQEYSMPDSPNEITTVIKGVYKNKQDEFAKWKQQAFQIAGGFGAMNKPDDEKTIAESPYFDDEVIQNLPELIKNSVGLLNDKRERDVFITSMLTFLGAMMGNVKGLYGYDYRHPGIYSFVCSPSNGGKGIAKLVYNAFLPYHQSIKVDGLMAEPIVDKGFFVSLNGNSTKQQLLIKANGGMGLLYEPGAESLPFIMKNDAAGINQILKYGFDHEMLTSARELNRRSVEVLKPRIGCYLGGNSFNLESLIPSVFSGLYPCFLFYAYYATQQWVKQKPGKAARHLQAEIDKLSQRVLKLAEYMKYYPMEFEMSDEQWDILDKTFEKSVTQIASFSGDVFNRYLRRLGVSTFRIAMILSTLEGFESGEQVTLIKCSDKAFKTAMSLSQTFLQHALIVQVNILEKEKLANNNLKEFFALMPSEAFSVKDAMKLADTLPAKLQNVTIYAYLKRLTEYGLLRKLENGSYEKVDFEYEILNFSFENAA